MSNFKKGYNKDDWMELCSNIVDFLLVFGAIINLIIFGFLGFNFSCLTSFVTLMVLGGCKLAMAMIKYSVRWDYEE